MCVFLGMSYYKQYSSFSKYLNGNRHHMFFPQFLLAKWEIVKSFLPNLQTVPIII